MRPSYVVGRIQRLFPELSVTDEEADQSFKKRVWTPENGLSCLTEGILKMKEGEFSPEFQELYLWYSKEPKWKGKAGASSPCGFRRERGFRHWKGGGEGPLRKRADQQREPAGDPSRPVPASISCGMALGLPSGKPLEFAPVDMGNLFHKALEIFSEKVEASRVDLV